MSDVVISARAARMTLAAALAQLQSEGVDPAFLQAADPIAEAMSALFDLEEAPEHQRHLAASALAAVQRALALLQETECDPARAEAAIAKVAEALGGVHALAHAAPAAVAEPSELALAPVTEEIPSTDPSTGFLGGAAQPVSVSPDTTADHLNDAFDPADEEPDAAPIPLSRQGKAPASAFDGSRTALIPQHLAGTLEQQLRAADPPASPPQPSLDAAAAAPPNGSTQASEQAAGSAPTRPALSIDTSLGVHSSNNFYHGLGGNDVLTHGGLFIATYSPPAVGQNVVLRVLMPGGYEFRARGVVRWCRDAPKTASAAPYAPPGFGAELVDVPEEGKRLIERYVKNRPPLFHES